MWGQLFVVALTLPLPTSWGWTKTEDGLYEPYWTTIGLHAATGENQPLHGCMETKNLGQALEACSNQNHHQ